MKCPFTHGLNKPRLFVSIMAVFVFILASDFLVHGKLLAEAYQSTASLWRTETDMQANMSWMFLGQLIAATFLTIIFARGYEGKGLKEGLSFGILIGPFSIAHAFIQYSTTPVPQSLLWAWVATGVAQGIIGSMIAAAIYKK